MPRFQRYSYPFQYYNNPYNYRPRTPTFNLAPPPEEVTPPPPPPSKPAKSSKSANPVWMDLFGIKLYFDDVLILSLLFFLYNEEVKDEGLFLALVMLLIS